MQDWFPSVATVELSPLVENFLKAWLLTKLTEPVRAGVTLVALPVLTRKLPPRLLALLQRKKL
jgi:hypothetical protein